MNAAAKSGQSRMRELGIATLVTLSAMAIYLFSPRVPHGQEDANCVTVMDIGPMHIHKNCDSEEFQYIARDPSLMFTPERKTRQNRPLYAVLGWVFARPFRTPGLETLGRRVLSGPDVQQTEKPGPNPGGFYPEYAGFILLNTVMLVASVMILARLLDARTLADAHVVLPLAIVVINQVTKAAFWTPHLQIFNVLIPLLSLLLYRWMIPRLASMKFSTIALIGFVLGISSLAYGAFAVAAAGAALCLVAGEGFREFRRRPIVKLAQSALMLATFLAPTIAWSAYVIRRTGSIYNQEIDLFRQFVWVGDSLRAGGKRMLLRDLIDKTGSYLRTLYVVAAFPAVVLLALGILGRASGGVRTLLRGDDTLLKAIAIFVVSDVLFYWLMGFYESRLSWTIVPALAVLSGVLLRAIARSLRAPQQKMLRAAAITVTVCYAAYWYTRSGPWS